MSTISSIIWFNILYPLMLGRLKSNLLSLELRIRHFLLICELGLEDSTEYLQYVSEWEIGLEINVNSFTNYDQLDRLIEKYNKQVSSFNNSTEIDKLKIDNADVIIKLRDALAHGRVFAYKDRPPLYLFKFSKLKDSNTKADVEFMSVMSWDWFNTQIKLTKNAYDKVEKACRKLV